MKPLPNKNTKLNRSPAATRSHIAFTKPGQKTQQTSTPPLRSDLIPQGAKTQINTPLQRPYTQEPQVLPPQIAGQTTVQQEIPPQQIQQSKAKRLVGIPINIQNQFTQASESPIEKPVNKIVESAIDDVKEQMQNYLEVCDTLSRRPIDIDYLIEVLFMFVRSLNFDFLVFLKASDKDYGFSNCSIRGVREPHPDFARSLSDCVSNGVVLWPELIKLTTLKEGSISRWISKEKISSIGYVPFQDGSEITGLMIVGSYGKKTKSAVASQLLELCGGRIGISLAYDACSNAQNQMLPELVSAVESHQKQAVEYFDLLSSSLGEKDDLAGKLLTKSKDSLLKASKDLEKIKTSFNKKRKI